MRETHTFLIESDGAKHKLRLDGQTIGMFPALEAAEAAANDIASRTVPGTSLRFEMDLASILMALEIRGATLEW